MLSFSLERLFGALERPFGRVRPGPDRGSHAEAGGDAPAPVAPASPKRAAEPATAWPSQRLALTDQIWGRGFIAPGGEIEILRLIRPLALSSASSLLLVGMGSGGALSVVVRNTGTWVTGMETDVSLIVAAQSLAKRDGLGRKATIRTWHPSKPEFGEKSYHHCLALEPLQAGAAEPILDGLAQAIRPGGHLVMTGLTAAEPLAAADAAVRRWAKLEKRDVAGMLPAVAVTRMLGRVGLDVRIAEDMSQRHLDDSLLGWRVLVRDLEESKPNPMTAAFMVAEAELWLLRRRLIGEGRLRMMRWHAMKRVPIV